MKTSRSPVREQILKAAQRLIEVRGYHRTTLDDVLRASGTGKGNFYHYFGSKEALGYAILDRLLQRFDENLLGPIFADPGRTPLAQVEAFLGEIVAAQRTRNCVGGCPLGNLAMELADTHEGFRQRLAGIFDRWQQCLADALARAQRAGSLSPDAEPDGLARFFVASLEGAILLTKVGKDIEVLESCVGIEPRAEPAGVSP